MGAIQSHEYNGGATYVHVYVYKHMYYVCMYASMIFYYYASNKMSTRNIKLIMFLGSEVRRVRRADNLIAICELTV
jgi:hypothetical protein